VSLGSGQTEAALDLEVVREFGLDVVQRGTGGGGILHNAQELTYAVVVPMDHPGLPADLPGSFAFLCRGVVLALRSLGVPAEIESAPDATRDALCYVRTQGTNIVSGGRKISGGAQRRSKWAVLQHGTVIVERDEARLARVFRTDPEIVRARVTSLAEHGLHPERPALVEALVEGFRAALGPLEVAAPPWGPAAA
jgi:lipoate-protein ligase A